MSRTAQRLLHTTLTSEPCRPFAPECWAKVCVASVIVLVVSDQCHGPCRRSMQRRAMSRTAPWVFEPICLLASARPGCYRGGTRTWVHGEHTERAKLHAHPVPRRVVAIAVDMNVSCAPFRLRFGNLLFAIAGAQQKFDVLDEETTSMQAERHEGRC